MAHYLSYMFCLYDMCGCEGEVVCVCVSELDCVATHAIDMAGEGPPGPNKSYRYIRHYDFHDHDGLRLLEAPNLIGYKTFVPFSKMSFPKPRSSKMELFK